MKSILKYTEFLNEMWDAIPDINVINRIPSGDENMTYEFEIDGAMYKVFIMVRRWEDNTVTLEIHFSSKAKITDTEYSDSLTGRNNMQDVMGSVWWAVKEWAKERSKGGDLSSIIVVAKSESQGDERRSKIYANFIAKKAQEAGMIITKTTDISDIYNDLMQSLRDSSAIVTKYSIERFPLDRLKSTSNIF
jgi:hypothetical protein